MDSRSGEDPTVAASDPTADGLRQTISGWTGVQIRDGGGRGMRFCAGRGEFLHFHGDRQVDIRLSPEERDAALAAGEAEFHPRSHEGGWVIVPIAPGCEAAVLRLSRAAYEGRRRHG